MRQSLHSHVLFLESRIQTLRDRLTMGPVTAEEIHEVERQLASAELALEHYRKAYALELGFSEPELPGGQIGGSGEGAGEPGRSNPEKKNDRGKIAAHRRRITRARFARRPGPGYPVCAMARVGPQDFIGLNSA